MFSRLFFVLFVSSVVSQPKPNYGPKYPPTKGEIWPHPLQQEVTDNYYSFDPTNFKMNIIGEKCPILTRAVDRYTDVAQEYANLSHKYGRSDGFLTAYSPNYQGIIKQLAIKLTQPCEKYPFLGMNESYVMTVSQHSMLISPSVWGILRGLESFAQLFYLTEDFTEVRINATQITDAPRYLHRGLMLDTSRHYIPIEHILATLEAMAMNKMNVFHWHIVDDQSFPYESEKFPDMSEKGAFHPTLVYTKKSVAHVIAFARDRGIRVIPEFDVPGHTASWGASYIHLLTPCYHTLKMAKDEPIGYGPLNPVQNVTYKVLRDLYAEVKKRFPDLYFHIGGDEVDFRCWQSNPEVSDYMKKHKLDVNALHAEFMSRVIPFLGDRAPIVWQEVFEEGVNLPANALVQVWKDGAVGTMTNVVRAGYKVLFSSDWYLDHLEQTFADMYASDPGQRVLEKTGNLTLASLVIGGEACMWGEMVDDNNVLPRIWPRASAVAEVLWSPAPPFNSWHYSGVRLSKGHTRTHWRYKPSNSAFQRIEEHVCRMIRRGIPVSPSAGPGFCLS